MNQCTTTKITDEQMRAKLTLFAFRKDEWDAKEGTGKSMKNALHAQQYDKRHLSG